MAPVGTPAPSPDDLKFATSMVGNRIDSHELSADFMELRHTYAYRVVLFFVFFFKGLLENKRTCWKHPGAECVSGVFNRERIGTKILFF